MHLITLHDQISHHQRQPPSSDAVVGEKHPAALGAVHHAAAAVGVDVRAEEEGEVARHLGRHGGRWDGQGRAWGVSSSPSSGPLCLCRVQGWRRKLPSPGLEEEAAARAQRGRHDDGSGRRQGPSVGVR